MCDGCSFAVLTPDHKLKIYAFDIWLFTIIEKAHKKNFLNIISFLYALCPNKKKEEYQVKIKQKIQIYYYSSQ
jgi:hypothetical protein